MTSNLVGQVSLFAPDTWSGKTSPEHSAATKDETSRQSSRRRSASSSRKPPVLKCLQKAGLPGAGIGTWTDDGAWLGEYTTRNTGECPSVAVESRLSQILEATPHTKYCLSARACQGILNRAARRGKALPKMLKAALIRQSQEVSPQERTEAPTLNAECGGNKPTVVAPVVPLTYQMQGFGDYRQADVASVCKQRDYKDSTDLVAGLDGECNSYTEQYGTLRAHTSGCAEETVMSRCVVRRLTPLECERLQGFPDGWTDIGDYTDSTGKKRRTSDSARYKALGNSIALPFWRWMFGRMAAYLPEGATLGSLFDGIGGFPLCWEDVHGAGTAIWASEIEEFPIAVTKKRFGGAIT